MTETVADAVRAMNSLGISAEAIANALALGLADIETILNPDPPPAAEPMEALSEAPRRQPSDNGGAAAAMFPDVAGRPADNSHAARGAIGARGRWSNAIPIGKSLRMFEGPLPPARTCQAFVSPDHLAPDARKCGKPSLPGYSWCAEHKARFVVVVPKRIPGAKPIGLPRPSGKLFHREDFEG